jgi:hypothetical protein
VATSDKKPPAGPRVTDTLPARKRRWSGWDVLVILVVVGIAGALWLPEIRAGTVTECTCAVCRAGRIERTFFGHLTIRLVETPCSEWYRANVEASHEHVWIYRSGWTRLNLLGRPVSAASGTNNPIWRITPEEQMDFYVHSADKLAMKRAFADLDRWKPGNERAEAFVGALKAWKASGFIGPWEKWVHTEPEK